MKKIKKMLKKLNNQGSSVVMVVAALGFIGIIVGALLMAAGYTYKQKLQDLNARDNFYYVEQAMNEIYAGVGSKTAENMQEAYIYTVENMVYFDLQTGTYRNRTDEEANRMFKEKFMELLSANPDFLDSAVATSLSKYITNSSVVLDASRLYVERIDADLDGKIESIVIKNVTLTRTANYNRSQANGAYTQRLSTDIVIGQPDFNVAFNSSTSGYSNLFQFATVADMGLEINQTAGNTLTIAGNVYAGSDYYNKKYNESTYKADVSDGDKTFAGTYAGESVSYNHGSVTSKRYVEGDSPLNTYYNVYSTLSPNPENPGLRDYYDGVNQRSANSGIYVNGSTVSILADTVIVPGTIAVMNSGNLSIYGKSGTATSESEVWTDNIVLDGTCRKVTTQSITGQPEIDYEGATALIRADVFVKDDTEINATGATFQLKGSYYGYGDSTAKDERDFIPTVLTENFQITNADGTVENRGHYNSSAIIVNGEHSLLNLEDTNTIYLAGRSYIELSKQVEQNEEDITVDGNTETIVRQTYTYTPMSEDNLLTDAVNDTVYIRDYKTGESISIKSNQKAYIPVMYTGVPTLSSVVTSESGTSSVRCYLAKLHPALTDAPLFVKYFPNLSFGNVDPATGTFSRQIPCVMQLVSGKKYYYIDFETAYYMAMRWNPEIIRGVYASPEEYAASFIKDYVAVLNGTFAADDENYASYLVDIRNFEDFEAGNIILPEMNNDLNVDAVNVYSSGAITSKNNTSFDMITKNSQADISTLLSSQRVTPGTENSATTALGFSDDLDVEYELMKWNLGHFVSATDPEVQYIKALLGDDDFGVGSITPINRYLNMRLVQSDSGTIGDLRPAKANETGNEPGVLKLESGYSVWVNNGVSSGTGDSDSVTISTTSADGVVKGIVIAKGDVYFDTSVRSFEGLVVSGGKVYINNNLSTFTASPEICRAVIRECQLSSDDKCKYLLSLFQGYEDSSIDDLTQPGTDKRTIDTIEYSDVVSFDNWMKNVE
ncbi:MAG: hypothetical protein NC393_01615 [Clostridium sp.]|nr:hypothetical protein [Clostridium sp.]MCM1209710.1 hypothetical protein [Ruminococcus sp.]